VSLKTEGKILSFTPASGSSLGGTLITINGYTFGTVDTDNPVKIGDTYCYVVTTSANQITCRVGPRTETTTDPQELIVFLKTSEEAVCDDGNDCMFTWIDSPSTVTNVYTEFDTTTNDYKLVIQGTGFTGDASTTQVLVDGVQQTITSISDTEIIIYGLTGITSTKASVQVYFPEGIPNGNNLLSAGVTFAPKLVSVSPSVGSPAGSILTASIKGVTTSTTSV
jgi:hypothetical protein